MIILFSNCGFAIIAFLFYLCGSNRVAEVFADFIVNNCYLISGFINYYFSYIFLFSSEKFIQISKSYIYDWVYNT